MAATSSWTASSRRAAPSWTRRTCTATAFPRRSSAAGSPAGPPTSPSRWCWPPRAGSRLGDDPNSAGLSARHLTRALDASLRRLGLDSVDLYQVHAYDALTPLEETLRTLDGFIRAGKIRYYGLSNFTGWQLTKTVYLARR